MGDVMIFPETAEEFMEQYKIIDSEQVYTNGSELIPIFRMKQWLEHLPANLNVYSVAFSRHKDKEWFCYDGYIFAKDEESLEALLNKQYGEVRIRYAQKVDIQEGTILYGERWKTING